jgi:copper chaperone CopZ
METIAFNVGKSLCEECSLALRRFIGHMNGVESIDVEEGKFFVSFDMAKITEEELRRLTRDSIEKLGYKLIEEEGREDISGGMQEESIA